MSADVLRIMSGVAFAIALAVVALTTYTATVGRLRDIAVLKALGASSRRIAAVTLGQALWTVVAALVVAVAATAGIGWLVATANPAVEITLTWASLRSAEIAGAVAAGLGAVVPLARVAGVDPATALGRAA